MLGLGYQDPPEALLLDRLRAVEELQQVVLLEVEGERAVGAVDLDPQRILATEGEPGGLEHARGATAEPGREQRGVVHRDIAARRVRAGVAVTAQARALTAQWPGLDECPQDRGNAGDLLAGQPLGGVDQVGTEVAQRAGPRLRFVQPPGHRGVGIVQPVLQVMRPHLVRRTGFHNADRRRP
jgi:hypothetical protein